MIAVQILIYLGFLILIFGHASPIRANWDNVPDARRWDRKYEIIHSRVANRKFYMPSDPSVKLRKTSHRNFGRRCPSAHANPTYPDSSPNTL
jgi:hypothetical protein